MCCVQWKDGDPCPPNSLKEIACGIHRTFVEEFYQGDINIFKRKKKDKTFKTFQKAIEKRKELLEMGV